MNSESVKAATRTVDLFETFARVQGPLSLTELAQHIGAPVSSVHALVRTLRARGYVYMLEERKLIYPTKRLLHIAQRVSKNDPVIEILGPTMRRLLAATDETIILGKHQGLYVTYLEVLESSQSIRYSAQPGDTKPLHSSAIGKAMLALLSEDELSRTVRKIDLPKVTDNTIVDQDLLIRNVREGREQGYFVTIGENVADVMAISVHCVVGGEHVGIAIAGPVHRLRLKEKEYADLLTAAATKLDAST